MSAEPSPRSSEPLMLPPLATLKVSLAWPRVTFSTPVTPPSIAVTSVRLPLPESVALTVLSEVE